MFQADPDMELTPTDLFHMSENQVVLEPASSSGPRFYSSVLRCRLCDARYTHLHYMIKHCKSIQHRHRLYKAQLQLSVDATVDSQSARSSPAPVLYLETHIPPPREARKEMIIPDRYVISCMRSLSEGVSRNELDNILLTAPPVGEYICELCQTCVRDLDRYLLHFSGFGHTERVARLRELGQTYYQAFVDHDSGDIFFLQIPEYSIVEQIPTSDRRPWYGYANISEISIIQPFLLTNFIKESL